MHLTPKLRQSYFNIKPLNEGGTNVPTLSVPEFIRQLEQSNFSYSY